MLYLELVVTFIHAAEFVLGCAAIAISEKETTASVIITSVVTTTTSGFFLDYLSLNVSAGDCSLSINLAQCAADENPICANPASITTGTASNGCESFTVTCPTGLALRFSTGGVGGQVRFFFTRTPSRQSRRFRRPSIANRTERFRTRPPETLFSTSIALIVDVDKCL